VRDRWDGHAGRDAGARHAAAAPAPGGAPARRDARARLPRRRYWGGDARARDAWLDARVDVRDPARTDLLLFGSRRATHGDLRAHPTGGRRFVRRAARLLAPGLVHRSREARDAGLDH